MMGQWASKHAEVCLLKNYSNYNAVCAFQQDTQSVLVSE